MIDLDSLEAKVALSELMEKDFHYLAYPSEQTELELSQSLQTFYQQFAYLSNLQEAFDRYQTDLVNLFSANTQLGLTPNQGIRGDLRRTVHTTEQEILSLQGDIESSILLAADKVKIQLHIFGGLLALILSGLLMLIGRNILGRVQSIKSMICLLYTSPSPRD